MDNANAVLQKYNHACELHSRACVDNPSHWHSLNSEFTALYGLLTPHAEAGNVWCQYALATIYWLGLCCENEEQYLKNYNTLLQKATQWWLAAASQGHWVALDNLITCGVGPESQGATKAFRQFKHQHQELVGQSHGMPIYGPEFMQELCRTLYGRVITDII